MKDLSLWLIWKEPITRRRYLIGELTYDFKVYRFKYTNPELEDAIKNNFTYYPGFRDLDKVYESSCLFTNISTRLPNPKRPDYLKILNSYGLEINSTQMDILKKTRGRLLTDNFEFVPKFDKNNKIEFEVAGTRHYIDKEKMKKILNINDNLELEREYDNEKDEYSIKVNYVTNEKKYQLGYVPRYYSKHLSKLLDEKIPYSAKVEFLNFDSLLTDENITVAVKLIFDIRNAK